MKVLVTYASKYGSTRQIAERIAETLRGTGLTVEIQRADKVSEVGTYDAFVVGSAVYYGSWMKDAAAFVLDNAEVLATHPTWLFSSGPISAGATDSQGRDLRVTSEPKQVAEFKAAISPRDHRIFWGALDRRKLGFADRLVASMPAFPGAEGDFRDWTDVAAWASTIATQLAARVPALVGA